MPYSRQGDQFLAEISTLSMFPEALLVAAIAIGIDTVRNSLTLSLKSCLYKEIYAIVGKWLCLQILEKQFWRFLWKISLTFLYF